MKGQESSRVCRSTATMTARMQLGEPQDETGRDEESDDDEEEEEEEEEQGDERDRTVLARERDFSHQLGMRCRVSGGCPSLKSLCQSLGKKGKGKVSKICEFTVSAFGSVDKPSQARNS